MRQTGRHKLIIVLILILSLCSAMFVSSYGVTQEEKDEALKAAEEAKEATAAKRKEVKAAAKKVAEATENFEEAERKLNELIGQVDAINAQIGAKRGEIDNTKKKIKKKQKDIEEQQNALNERLTAMYKTGNVGMVDVILNSEDVEDLLTNVGMVHKILESDQKLMKKLQKQYKKLKKLKNRLIEQKKELEEQEIQLEARQAEVEELKNKYQAEADKNKAMEDELEAQAKELAAEAKRMQAEAEAMIVEQGGDVEVEPGEYAFPTNGNWKITSNYGWRICPFHGKEFHNGCDIVLTSGTYGSPVYAIADGVITRASWYGGYGKCIQLACGGGYSALYGHLSGYNCSKGQFVTKGTVIGYIGSTGNSTGPYLHFSVYKDGEMTNPLGLY